MGEVVAIGGEQLGGLLGPRNVLWFDLGTGYIVVSSITKLTELEMYDSGNFLHCATLNKNFY